MKEVGPDEPGQLLPPKLHRKLMIFQDSVADPSGTPDTNYGTALESKTNFRPDLAYRIRVVIIAFFVYLQCKPRDNFGCRKACTSYACKY